MSAHGMQSTPYDQFSRDERRKFTATMLRRASETQDEADRKAVLDDVVLANLGVARSIASRYRSRGIATDDLEQVACAALVRAVHRFDGRLASDFLAYAVPSIRGELRRYFRDSGWMVRPPRRVQELQSRVVEARERLRAEAGGSCSHADIAEALGVSESDVAEALAAEGCFTPTSLDLPMGEGSTSTLGDLLRDPQEEGAATAAEARAMLRPVVRRLSARDQSLLRLRYFDERTQQEIADEFGVTQTQVSRLLSKVLRDLRAGLIGATPQLED